MIKVHDKFFKPYISAAQIAERVKFIANGIKTDFEGKRPLMLSVLNGSFVFAGDLMRALDMECEISFIKLRSYSGTESTGKIVELIGVDESVEEREIIVVEDIVDTGRTMRSVIDTLIEHGAASVKIASLLFKPDKFEYDYGIDYLGFEIPPDFVVGYGLDYDGLGRNYADIYMLA